MCTHCGICEHIVAKCYRIHGYPPGYRVSNNAKGKLPQNNGIHMVYMPMENMLQEQIVNQSQYNMASLNGLVTPQNHIFSYNGTTYVHVASHNNQPENSVVNVGTANYPVNMIQSGTSLAVGNISQGSEQITQLIAQLNRQLQDSEYQVIAPTSASTHSV